MKSSGKSSETEARRKIYKSALCACAVPAQSEKLDGKKGILSGRGNMYTLRRLWNRLPKVHILGLGVPW